MQFQAPRNLALNKTKPLLRQQQCTTHPVYLNDTPAASAVCALHTEKMLS